MIRALRKMPMIGTIALGLAATACNKKDDDKAETDSTTTTAPTSSGGDSDQPKAATPGALMVTLDSSMGSVALPGQSGAALHLASSDWVNTHCQESGSGVKEAFYGKEDIEWGCKFAVATDGPDTPRGGLQRIKSIVCSLDKAIAAGTFSFNGVATDLTIALEPECWGESFSNMAKEELSGSLNADGWAEGPIGFTGHATVPATMTDAAGWEQALEIDWGKLTGEEFTYTMLMKFSEPLLAVLILEKQDGQENSFGISLDFKEGAEDIATFRYIGRFAYGEWGDGGSGSRHVRMMTSGPYTGNGTFSTITSGRGFEAEDYGTGNGALSVFEVNTDGLMTRNTQVTASTGAVSGEPTVTWNGAAGTTAPTGLTYSGASEEKQTFLSPNLDSGYTATATWFKAQTPFSYESVTLTDD